MLWYFFRKTFPLFFLVIVLCCFRQCHTVALETKPNDSSLDPSPILSLHNQKTFKREIGRTEDEEKSNQTKNVNISDEKFTSIAPTSNQTLSQVKPPVASGEFNSTQSLPPWMATIKSGALERTGFVALGFMLIIVVFFVVRAIRLRHKRSKSRKYGIITSTDMEMEPLDKDDDEEEDTTLFDAQQKYTLP